MSVQTRARGINWFAAVCIHADRLLKHRLRSPAAIASAVGMPVVMIVPAFLLCNGPARRFGQGLIAHAGRNHHFRRVGPAP